MVPYNSVKPKSLGSKARPADSPFIPPKKKLKAKPVPAPVPASSPAMSTNNNNEFPESLTKLVQDCYLKAGKLQFSGQQMSEMALQLKTLIEKAQQSGKLLINDWSQQSLPIFDRSSELELFCDLPAASSSRFSTSGSGSSSASSSSSRNDKSINASSRLQKRAERFEKELSYSPRKELYHNNVNMETGASREPLIGTCQDLEKSYLRLTSAPDPKKVRPLPVLIRSFDFILHKYEKEGKYPYICDQFKSLRQDLRVQLIENEFTVKVYETHSRIAIKHQDLGEFNQCQSVLKTLYNKKALINSPNELEFKSYRILYLLFTKNFNLISTIKLSLSDQDKLNPFISQSLKIVEASIKSNYHQLFKLYSKSENTTKDLLNCFINNERIKAMAIICTSYKILNMEFLLSELHFSDENDCLKFIALQKLDQFIELKNENLYLNTSKARPTVLTSLKSTQKIDIKGQI